MGAGQFSFSKGYEMVMPELFKKITNNEFDPRDIITHKMSLEEASHGYRIFNNREDECIKVVLKR